MSEAEIRDQELDGLSSERGGGAAGMTGLQREGVCRVGKLDQRLSQPETDTEIETKVETRKLRD